MKKTFLRTLLIGHVLIVLALHAKNEFVLQNSAGLKAIIVNHYEYLNKRYGYRFEELGFVKQISFQGEDFLGKAGLIDEMGIKMPLGPLGFHEASLDEGFIKIGVGELKKDRKEKYKFQHHYPLLFKHPIEFDMPDSSTLLFKEKRLNKKRWNYVYTKTYQLDSNRMNIFYRFENKGPDTIVSNQYNHNWIRYKRQELVDGFHLKNPSGKGWTFSKVSPMGRFKMLFQRDSKTDSIFRNGHSLQLIAPGSTRKTGLAGDFAPQMIALYTEKNYICPEIFYLLRSLPGETKTWTRTYTFN